MEKNLEKSNDPATAKDSLVGKDINAYCKKCTSNQEHIIVTTKGDKATRVKCHECGDEHPYKSPQNLDGLAVDFSGTHTELEWEKLMNAHKDAPIKSYAMKGKYTLGDKLGHPTFGDGIVSKHIYPNKIEVIFKDAVKILIYSGNS
ncbi:MAG: hypothetical protein HY072_03560 [Deltaproteobacteria bacterium]|nr:hypothetical protein [Deltaproteobacteria bacterium]